MLSEMPIDLDKVEQANIDRELLRGAVIAELDAINLYEQMAAMTRDPDLKRVLLDVAREEKAHGGEFQELLLRLDEEQAEEVREGRKEIQELLG